MPRAWILPILEISFYLNVTRTLCLSYSLQAASLAGLVDEVISVLLSCEHAGYGYEEEVPI
jgi:hypothetical protein